MKILQILIAGLALALPVQAAELDGPTIEDELLTWVVMPCVHVQLASWRSNWEDHQWGQVVDSQREGLIELMLRHNQGKNWNDLITEGANILRGMSFHARRRASGVLLKSCVESVKI